MPSVGCVLMMIDLLFASLIVSAPAQVTFMSTANPRMCFESSAGAVPSFCIPNPINISLAATIDFSFEYLPSTS